MYMCICDQDSVQRDGSFVRSFVDTARRHGSVRSVVRWLAGRLTSDEVITVDHNGICFRRSIIISALSRREWSVRASSDER